MWESLKTEQMIGIVYKEKFTFFELGNFIYIFLLETAKEDNFSWNLFGPIHY